MNWVGFIRCLFVMIEDSSSSVTNLRVLLTSTYDSCRHNSFFWWKGGKLKISVSGLSIKGLSETYSMSVLSLLVYIFLLVKIGVEVVIDPLFIVFCLLISSHLNSTQVVWWFSLLFICFLM